MNVASVGSSNANKPISDDSSSSRILRKRKGQSPSMEPTPPKKSRGKKEDKKFEDVIVTVSETPPASSVLKTSTIAVEVTSDIQQLHDVTAPFTGFEPENKAPSDVVIDLEAASPVARPKQPVIPTSIPVKDDIVIEAAAKTKRVYVGHIKGDLPADIIHAHLVNKLPGIDINKMRVDKIKSNQTRKSSFIVHTNENEDLFKMIMDKAIWPNGVIVQQHFRRRKPRRTAN